MHSGIDADAAVSQRLVAFGQVRWPDWFPQLDPGRKHERPIVLEPWQQVIVDREPEAFRRGLIQSDGCRVINCFTTKLRSGRVAEYAGADLADREGPVRTAQRRSPPASTLGSWTSAARSPPRRAARHRPDRCAGRAAGRGSSEAILATVAIIAGGTAVKSSAPTRLLSLPAFQYPWRGRAA